MPNELPYELSNARADHNVFKRALVSAGKSVLCGLLMLLTPANSASSTADALTPSTLIAAIEIYNQHQTVKLPVPSHEELSTLGRGGIVKIREQKTMLDSLENEQERIRIVGYRVYEQPRLLVWLGALDFDTQHSKRLTEHLVEAEPGGSSRWYQYVRLPWPVKNRHWVVRSFKDTELSRATDGFIWQHSWALDDNGQETAARLLANQEVDGVTSKQGSKAVYVPVNRGGWTMFELDERRVLVAAHVTSVLGGWVPDTLVARVVSSQLQSMLTNLEDEAAGIHQRYDGQSVVLTGDGQPITVSMAKEACALGKQANTTC